MSRPGHVGNGHGRVVDDTVPPAGTALRCQPSLAAPESTVFTPADVSGFRRALREGWSLRALQLEDADELFACIERERAHLRQWLPWLDATRTVEDQRRFLVSVSAQHRIGGQLTCALCLEERIVGVVGYHRFDPIQRVGPIGYWLSAGLQGQGAMTQAVAALVDHGFTSLGLSTVTLAVGIGNVRSRALPARLGFTQGGLTQNAEWLYDHHVDHVHYSLTREDWTPRRAA